MFRFIYAFWFLSWNRLRHGSVAAAECEWCMAIEKTKTLIKSYQAMKSLNHGRSDDVAHTHTHAIN